ncbi:response regulator [Spirosoma soli]|uniref:Response regulator n=1 Tax=Spirosoma soli TaxID=1770529 RepID=A0ABW5M0B5_9BACT
MKHIVYLVDDDEDDCYLAQIALNPRADCELKTFHDGQELIAFLRMHPGLPLPTLILLDLNMPVLNGFDTLVALKNHSHWASIDVVVLTTSDHQVDKDRCLALGAEGFLTKPTDFSSLQEVLASVSTCWQRLSAIEHLR